jgi:acyl-CoA reductase-like NAD-dependent aldehyde dehydrogenase
MMFSNLSVNTVYTVNYKPYIVPTIYRTKYQIGKRSKEENAPPAASSSFSLTAEELLFYVMDIKAGGLLSSLEEKLELVSDATGEPLQKPTAEQLQEVKRKLRAVAAKAFKPGNYTPEKAKEAIAITTKSNTEKAKQALYLIKAWSLLPLGVNIVNIY